MISELGIAIKLEEPSSDMPDGLGVYSDLICLTVDGIEEADFPSEGWVRDKTGKTQLWLYEGGPSAFRYNGNGYTTIFGTKGEVEGAKKEGDEIVEGTGTAKKRP